ncbi:hypothetical protein EJB05_03147, partial [Eragrostis curvula]
MGGGGGGLLQLWREWGIQILVLLSFALQVILLLVGGMRRRGLSAWQRVALWFAYLLADSTAIYALGHLSITSESREHRLVAFWAPFLLLHLGGPHNVTAYALEDNRLWLRHLQTLVVQVLGAAYVLYKYMRGSGTLLMLASVSMFVAGLAKYGERTWALRCANKSIRSSSSSDGGTGTKQTKDNEAYVFRLLRPEDKGDDEMILLRAHTQFPICRSLFSDAKAVIRSDRYPYNAGLRPFKGEDIFKLLEMELSLMYDTLYTKAPVIHTWYGFCIHFISLAGTLTALCLFHLSVVSTRRRGNHGYNRADVAISYVLLAGALVLETMSACRAVFSSRTCSLILCKAEHSPRACAWIRWLHSALRKPFKPASRRLWRGTMGQYNLIHLSTRDRTDLGSKLAAKLGLEDWWNKLHFSGTFSGTDSLPMWQFKELLEKTVQRERFATQPVVPLSACYRKGGFILNNKQALKGVAGWTVQNTEFDETVVIWHVATDIFISEITAAAGHDNYDAKLVEATTVLSNYMMFLLVAKPNMLPGRERHNVHLKTSRLMKEWRQNHVLCDEDNPVRPSSGSWWNKCCTHMELFHNEGPDCSTGISDQVEKKKLAESLCRTWTPQLGEDMDRNPGGLVSTLDDGAHGVASYLAKQLLHLGMHDTLELIFAVWVEIMLYAAEYAPRDSHARELGNGGEFITIVWLLVLHYHYIHRHKIA